MTPSTIDSNSTGNIFSTLADDPDLGELVDLFVSELRDRVDALQEAFGRGDLEALSRLAHQLKGASGSYGFHPLTPVLRDLELHARDSQSAEQIARSLGAVRDICQRVRSGVPS